MNDKRKKKNQPNPRICSFKIHFDGVAFKEDQAGIGVMIKDNRGLVIALMFQKIDLPHSIGEVEAMVVVRTFKFSLEVGIDTTILEGDYEIIINSLNDETASLASFGHLILDAKLFVHILKKISFSQVHPQGNFVSIILLNM